MSEQSKFAERLKTALPTAATVAYLGAIGLGERLGDNAGPLANKLASRTKDLYQEFKVRRLIAPLNDWRFDDWRWQQDQIRMIVPPRADQESDT